MPVLRANNLQGRSFDLDDLVYVPRSYVSQQQFLRAGDVVVATSSGSISVVGKAVAVQQDIDAGFGAFCGVLRPAPSINKRYFGHYFSSDAYRSRVSELARGVNINNLKREHFASLELPVAPEKEQQRVADKLDAVLSRADACRERLDRVAPLIKRFRQSVLAAATSGQLTERWRKTAGEQLLTVPFERLLSSRAGSLKRGPFGSSIKKAFFVQHGYKVYEQKNAIQDDETIGDYFIDEAKYAELEEFAVDSGDFLVSCAGTIGRITRLSASAPKGVINQALMRIRINEREVSPQYFRLLFEAPWFQSAILDRTQGSAMQNMAAVKVIKQVPVVLPSSAEQAEVVRRVEALLAIADRLEARLTHAKAAVDRLTPSLLDTAFRGQLVPQDPADQPASELLARLLQGQQESGEAAVLKRPRGRPKKAA